MVDDDRCQCGEPRSESFAPDNEFSYTAKAWQCHACKARVEKENQLEGSDSHRYFYFTVDKEG